MRVIKPSAINDFYAKHRDAEAWLKNWLLIVEKAEWQDIGDVRKTYKSADAAIADSGAMLTIFNVRETVIV
jgi:mRNA-degrading endonuclease HigB of HigAB toxin-antitoxin module